MGEPGWEYAEFEDYLKVFNMSFQREGSGTWWVFVWTGVEGRGGEHEAIHPMFASWYELLRVLITIRDTSC